MFENMSFLEIARIVGFSCYFFFVWGSFCSKKKLIAHRHTVQTVKINQTQLMEQTTLRRWKWSPLTICIDFSIHMSFFLLCRFFLFRFHWMDCTYVLDYNVLFYLHSVYLFRLLQYQYKHTQPTNLCVFAIGSLFYAEYFIYSRRKKMPCIKRKTK